MKAGILYILLFAVLILFIPMLALGGISQKAPEQEVQVHAPTAPTGQQKDEREPAAETEPENAEVEEGGSVEEPISEEESRVVVVDEPEEDPQPDVPLSDRGVASFRILDETTGEVAQVSLREYVRGAVAAEMPVSFHSEALKAQAVAAHTYALHHHYLQQEGPDPALQGADFSADPGNRQVYMTEATARAFYGDQADEAWEKICQAVDSVLEYVLEYDDEPIVAAYHAISGGQTEDAVNVWGGEAPYLLPADSEGDLQAPDYETVVELEAEELRARMAAMFPEIQLGADPAGWFGDEERSGSGYVTAIQVGDGSLHGKDIRQLADLRSHNFSVEYREGVFVFRVLGYGHGVGLSQYGADYLATQGYTFDEILANYYTDATLKRIDLVDAVLEN